MSTARLTDMSEYEAQFPLPLLPRDRCDRCGAQAHVATQHEGGELLWCCHHFTEHEARLKQAASRSSTRSTASPCSP